MARTRAQRQVYADLLARYGRAVADAFFAAIDSITRRADLARITAAIEAGDIEGALDQLDIDPAAFNEMLDRIRDAQTEGGKFSTDTMPKRKPDGTALTVRFDGRALGAENWMREHSSRLITRTTADLRQAARQSLVGSLERGDGPSAAALDLVGRVSRVTGRREGGILGLTAPQEEAARRARDELASTDPTKLNNYLDRKKRNRNFDGAVRRARDTGKPIPKETQAKALTSYRNRLLKLRGDTIGRVEAMSALQNGKREAFQQAIDSGKVNGADVRKAWRSASDGRVRDTHRGLNGESASFNEPFRSPSGAMMQHPMDTSMGAGPDEIINCRCDCEYRIDFLANLR